MTPCSHGMPTPAACLDCMDEGNLPPAPKPEPETTDYVFTAKFDGQCTVCDLPTRAGDLIAKTTVGRYVHAECARD